MHPASGGRVVAGAALSPAAASGQRPATSDPRSRPDTPVTKRGLDRTIWRIGGPLLALQATVLVGLSVVQYHRFELSFDFATYYQAWWLIGHGHLDPVSTTLGIPFVANDFELLMWPLALLEKLSTSPLVLLAVEDLAIVATNAVTLSWALAVLERSALPMSRRRAIAAFALVSLLVNPWCYETALWAFHPASIVALLAVLAGRDLWRGAHARLFLWVPLLLATGLLGGLAVVGLGITAILLGRGRWHVGWPLAALGFAYLVILGQLHLVGAGGGYTDVAFAYLFPHRHGPLTGLDVARGLLERPTLALGALAKSLPIVLLFLLPSGLLGVTSRWGIGMGLAILLLPALASPLLLSPDSAFQAWPTLPFLLVGTVVVLARFRWPNAGSGRLVPLLTGTCSIVVVLTAFTWLPRVCSVWIPPVPAGGTGLLTRLEHELPAHGELIAWNAVAGRFANQRDLHVVVLARGLLPVNRPIVTLLMAQSELGESPPVRLGTLFSRRLVSIDHATVLMRQDGVVVLRWHPNVAVRSIWFPSADPVTIGPRVIPVFGPLSP